MFKFMKSKKGFTLVELMIVVVMMAILVAVAVPIFSAVTKNARIKTCEANRREIISQLNNWAMGSVDGKQHTYTAEDALEFTIAADGTVTGLPEAAGTGVFLAQPTFEGLFQAVPACPKEEATLKVTISAVTEVTGVDQTANITAECNYHRGGDLEETAAANDGE